MTYQFVTEQHDYSDLASGAVLRSAPGHPAFPVRLASEVFLRAWHALEEARPLTVWDPCCGSGYLLTVLGLLHRDKIAGLIASDIADDPLRIARANLALLSTRGLRRRTAELDELARRFGRPSYVNAAGAARRLQELLSRSGGQDLPHVVGQTDVFDQRQVAALLAVSPQPRLVLTDVPYGEQTAWQGAGQAEGVPNLLRSLASALPADTMIAMIARGRRVPLPAGVHATARFKIGTRAVVLVRLRDLHATLVGVSGA
ncbi:rRNA methyltransferase [Micromonospora sp. NBC_01699]|uniref:rRNA methyltransferase n=1 Tax=Micromonospora sp. NBC_01699 TaxID=2975984 RepID=UPI002E33762B|nr:rRNA methyltransferase [Micromonospora sp. NBC_01699]